MVKVHVSSSKALRPMRLHDLLMATLFNLEALPRSALECSLPKKSCIVA